jgi:hypothetical protein
VTTGFALHARDPDDVPLKVSVICSPGTPNTLGATPAVARTEGCWASGMPAIAVELGAVLNVVDWELTFHVIETPP